MSSYSWSWSPPSLKTSDLDENNAVKVMKSLPEHIRDSIPVEVYRDSGNVTVLSVYWDEDFNKLCIDVGINE